METTEQPGLTDWENPPSLEDLKKNFEHGQQAILAEQAAEALNQGKE